MKQNGQTLKLLKEIEGKGIPSLDCRVLRQGECVFSYRSGYIDKAKTKPVSGKERYNLYSCSKLITCTAAFQLIEKGMLRLDDAVHEYLPEFRHLKKKTDGKLEDVRNTMTIRHLFTMTAGLTYDVCSENIRYGIAETSGAMPTREAMKYLACDPLIFEPGTNWNYSLCHDVLAAVVEVISGKRFGLYVKENIFDRLGMTNSTFLLPQNELEGITGQYRYDSEKEEYIFCGPEIQGYKLGSEYESGGAGCISTAEDYLRFLEGLRTGEQLLRRDTIAMMASPQISGAAVDSYADFGITEYSYGFGVRCPKPGGSVQDYGWSGAAGAYLAVFPDKDVTLFYVQHVLSSPVRQERKMLPGCILRDLQ